MLPRLFFLLLCLPALSLAATVSYEFDIQTTPLAPAGRVVQALTINGQLPAPTIRATVGDVLRVTFNNHLEEATSVHWHGILLPPDQDGVPYLNTRPIPAGGSHTFEFPISHAGTFWYHSHTELQIQRGLYGAVVLSENSDAPPLQEAVVLFSDWTDEDSEVVLANLKKSDDFYAWKKGNVQSWDKVIANGSAALSNRLNSAITRMGPMDISDVGYDAFLVNGQAENQLELDGAEADTIKLRLVNGSTSSYYDVEYAGGPMTVVAADGQDVRPVRVQRLRISTAETYDVLVPLSAGTSFELRATSVDGTGYSRLWVGQGTPVAAPDIPAPNLFLMNHGQMDMPGMNMGGAGHGMSMGMADPVNPAMPSRQQAGGHADHAPQSSAVGHGELAEHGVSEEHTDHGSREENADHGGLADAAPHSHQEMMAEPDEVVPHMLDYRHLIAAETSALPAEQTWREIDLTLTGNMERYVWSFNGKPFREEPQILIRKGENVRFRLRNETMMHHPLHLHGHFFRVVNGQGQRSPLKHTVNVPPMDSVVIEFDAREDQDWLFHCHNQYHMKSGMNRVISYEESSIFSPLIQRQTLPDQRWFSLNEFHLMSSFMDFEYTLSDERHSFDFELEADLGDTYEVHLLYNYHINRYLSAFAGMESREHHHDDSHNIAIAGFNLVLPFMIDSEWRVDDHGEFRLELESDIQLTRRIGFDWRWNSENERRYGFNYRVNNRFSITLHTDTEYGDGIGFKFFY